MQTISSNSLAPLQLNPAAHSQRFSTAAHNHLPLVIRVLRRLGVAEADLEDLAQELLFALSKKLPQVDPGKEAAFLIRACSYEVHKYRRGMARRRRKLEAWAEQPVFAGEDPEALLHRKRVRERLDAMMAELSQPSREVFALCEMQGLGLREVASQLEIPLGTAKSRLRRARESVHQALESGFLGAEVC